MCVLCVSGTECLSGVSAAIRTGGVGGAVGVVTDAKSHKIRDPTTGSWLTVTEAVRIVLWWLVVWPARRRSRMWKEPHPVAPNIN